MKVSNAQWPKEPLEAFASILFSFCGDSVPQSLLPEPPDILPICVYGEYFKERGGQYGARWRSARYQLCIIP